MHARHCVALEIGKPRRHALSEVCNSDWRPMQTCAGGLDAVVYTPTSSSPPSSRRHARTLQPGPAGAAGPGAGRSPWGWRSPPPRRLPRPGSGRPARGARPAPAPQRPLRWQRRRPRPRPRPRPAGPAARARSRRLQQRARAHVSCRAPSPRQRGRVAHHARARAVLSPVSRSVGHSQKLQPFRSLLRTSLT